MTNDPFDFMNKILAQALGIKGEEQTYTDLMFDETTKDLEEDMIEKKPFRDGFSRIFRFKNEYGASCVKHWGSYGSEEDFWEIAVIKFNDNNKWDICYDTKITDDVIGWLDNDGVMKTLRQIKNL